MLNLHNSASHHRERPDTTVSSMNIKHASVSYNAINKNRLNKNNENQRDWKQMWGITRQKMFSLFFHAGQRDRGMLGTDESHQPHSEEILKKKVRHTQTLKPQTKSHLFGVWRSIFATTDGVCWWTLCHPALSLPSDTLAGTKTRVLLSTQPLLLPLYNPPSVNLAWLCPPFLHNQANLLALKTVQKTTESKQIVNSTGHGTFTLEKTTRETDGERAQISLELNRADTWFLGLMPMAILNQNSELIISNV